MKRLVVVVLVVLVVGLVVSTTWLLLGWPPVRYVLRYGPSPSCAPTGRTRTIEGVTFVEIGAGVFRMGSTHGAGGDELGRLCKSLGLPWGEQPQPTDEMPVHWVEFPRGFWIARTEVTNAQWGRFRPDHERSEYSSGDDHPVVEVSFTDAKEYCAWLSEMSGLPVRLPSESEWEAACRGGSRGEYCFGDEEEGLVEYAWFGANAKGGAHEVATRRANAWGLFDLHGNVWEWCEDTYHASYEGAPADGSAWTEGGEEWGGHAAPRRPRRELAQPGRGLPVRVPVQAPPGQPEQGPGLPPRIRGLGPLSHRALGRARASRRSCLHRPPRLRRGSEPRWGSRSAGAGSREVWCVEKKS